MANRRIDTSKITAKKMLDLIDEVFARGDDESIKLQHVLSAIRGPDTDRSQKAKTTTYIRSAAFPKTKKVTYYPLFRCTMSFETSSEQFEMSKTYNHFKLSYYESSKRT